MSDLTDRLTDRELQALRNLGNEAERAADEIAALRAEVERLKLDSGELRLCVTCGKVRNASIPKDEPGCEPSEYGHLCQFDATPMEAFLHWRLVAHDRAAELFALRAEVERLTACRTYEQHRSDRIGTHGPGCWEWGPAHYECALVEVEALRRPGYVLVPREPTKAMIAAIDNAMWPGASEKAYRAMIDAATAAQEKP